MALVLIVIDEPNTMLVVRRDLETFGHQTALAADADVALERLAALPIDVVLLDIMMPVRDGWVVLEALRDQLLGPRRLPGPPVVVISGSADEADLERATRMGAVVSLVLPTTPQSINDAIARALVATS